MILKKNRECKMSLKQTAKPVVFGAIPTKRQTILYDNNENLLYILILFICVMYMSKYIANIAINKCVYHLSNHHSTGSALFGHSRYVIMRLKLWLKIKMKWEFWRSFLSIIYRIYVLGQAIILNIILYYFGHLILNAI